MSLTVKKARPVEKVRGRKPRRVQRRRTKGWNMPSTAIYVGRPSPWANGWQIGEPDPDTGVPMTRRDVIERYRRMLEEASPQSLTRLRERLGGHDLACWCAPSQDCHADLLLAYANRVDG